MKPHMKLGLFLTFRVRKYTTFSPALHLGERNILVRNIPLPPGFRRGWEINVRKVITLRIGVFLLFLRVNVSYIGVLRGV